MKSGIERRCFNAIQMRIGRSIAYPFTLVIKAKYIHYLWERHLRFGIVHGGRGRSSTVFLFNDVVQFLRPRRTFPACILLSHFIPKAPRYNRRMISVPSYKSPDIRLMPVRKDQMKVQGSLFSVPAIKYFIYYKKAHAISQVQQFRCWWIMRQADRIASHIAQDLQLSFCCPCIKSSAESS